MAAASWILLLLLSSAAAIWVPGPEALAATERREIRVPHREQRDNALRRVDCGDAAVF